MILHIKSIRPLLSLGTTVLQIEATNVSQTDLQMLAEAKEADYELVKVRKKRSLSANAYAWVLFDEIAKAVNTTKENVYRHAIRDVGVYSEMSFASKEAMDGFKRYWHSMGLGWVTLTTGELTLQAYYGSSTYKQEDMSRLIEWAVDNCKQMGIPTMSDDELSEMIGRWKQVERG